MDAEDHQWKAGETAYTTSGQEVEFVANTSDGLFVVRPYFLTPDQYGDDIALPGDLITVAHLFKKPPVEKLCAEVKQLSDEVAARRNELNEARIAILSAQKEDEQRRAEIEGRASQHAALERIFDVLDGKITHFVIDRYRGPQILTKDEALKDHTSSGRSLETKLVSLFGRSCGNLEWRINDYYDGSGSWHQMWPFCSEDAARAKVVDLLTMRFQSYLDGERASCLTEAIAVAEKIGHPVPEAVIEKRRAGELKRLEHAAAEAKAKHEETQKALREARRQL